MCRCNIRGRIEQELSRAEMFHCSIVGQKERKKDASIADLVIPDLISGTNNSISRSIRTITQAPAPHNRASQVFSMSNITMHGVEET